MTDTTQQLETATPALDVDSLMKRCLGRIDLVERVLSRFETAFADELEQLEAALQREEIEAVAAIAHRIKGTSLTVSATELSQSAAELERLALEGKGDELAACFAAIQQSWTRVQESMPLDPPKPIN